MACNFTSILLDALACIQAGKKKENVMATTMKDQNQLTVAETTD